MLLCNYGLLLQLTNPNQIWRQLRKICFLKRMMMLSTGNCVNADALCILMPINIFGIKFGKPVNSCNHNYNKNRYCFCYSLFLVENAVEDEPSSTQNSEVESPYKKQKITHSGGKIAVKDEPSSTQTSKVESPYNEQKITHNRCSQVVLKNGEVEYTVQQKMVKRCEDGAQMTTLKTKQWTEKNKRLRDFDDCCFD